MMIVINFDEANELLSSIIIESQYMAESGDATLAKTGRTILAISAVLYKILHGVTASVFDAIEIPSEVAKESEENKA